MDDPSRWMPLESTPQGIGRYIKHLGAENVSVHDILALEQWAYDMIPGNATAVFMLYPLTDKVVAFEEGEEDVSRSFGEVSERVFHMLQLVDNSCGTVAILHALGNMKNTVNYSSGSAAESFLSKVETMNSDERAQEMSKSRELKEHHSQNAEEGLTAIQSDVDTHFVCLICIDNFIYKLDGRRPGPIIVATCGNGGFLPAVGEYVKTVMAVDPDDSRYSLLVMCS